MKYLLNILTQTFFILILVSSCNATTPIKKTVPNAVPASTHKMDSYFQESRKINSATTVAESIELAQKDPSNSEPLYSLGYSHMQSGIATKNRRELELSEIYLKEVLRAFPGNRAVLIALYNVYYENILRAYNTNSFSDAKTVFMQLPDSSRAIMNPPSLARFVATAIQQEKDRQLNIQTLRDILLEAIQESPQTDAPYIHLAKLYRDDRYFALAIATLKLGEENIRTSVDLYKAIADTYVKRAEVNGCNYEHKSDIENAGKYYQLAIPLKPDDQSLHIALSQSFLDQGRNQLALNEAKVVLDFKTSNESLSLYAQSLSALGYHDQAIKFLEQAVAQGYSRNHAGYHEIYMNQGDWKNAAIGFSAYTSNREQFTVYDLIKSDIIAQQTHSQSVLPESKVVVSNQWEKALLNYWGAQSTADDLKKVAFTNCEKTEYYFYTGYKDLQAGRTTQARTKFSEAINQNTYRFIERPLAQYFLQH